MTIFNKKLTEATDNPDDQFFSKEPNQGKGTGTYITFFENDQSAAKMVEYVGDDLATDPIVGVEKIDKPSMFNGWGLSGTFVRFVPKLRTIDEYRTFIAALD